MSIVRYDPWSSLLDLHDALGRHVVRGDDDSYLAMTDWIPALDIKSEPNRYLIRVDVPGVESDKIDVSVENNYLTIKGSRDTETKESKEGFSRIERVSGSFIRRLSLPDDVDSADIGAHVKNGVLEIEIPKSKQKGAKKISVKEKA